MEWKEDLASIVSFNLKYFSMLKLNTEETYNLSGHCQSTEKSLEVSFPSAVIFQAMFLSRDKADRKIASHIE